MKYTAQVILFNEHNQVLCVSRKDDHSNFGLAGGKKEDEDIDLEDTAIRELFEETGLIIEKKSLTLVLAIHKDGYMSYTYLADSFTGSIYTEEPHVVKWGTFDDLIAGSFGKYNQLVYESIQDIVYESIQDINNLI